MEGATWAPGVCGRGRKGPPVGEGVKASALQLLGGKPAEERQGDAWQGSGRANWTKESFTGERLTEKGDSGLGPLIYTKANRILLAATDGAPTSQATDNARLGARPYIARPLSLSKRGKCGARSGQKGSPAARAGLHTYADFSCILICYLKCKEGERHIRLSAFRLRELRCASSKGTLRGRARTRNRPGCSQAEVTKDMRISWSFTQKEAGLGASMVPGQGEAALAHLASRE